MVRFFWLTLFSLPSLIATPSPENIFYRLDPQSIQQNLALWELYPESVGGLAALKRVSQLLKLSEGGCHFLKNCINPFSKIEELSDEVITEIEKIASHLPNRQLKGYHATSESQVLALLPEEIDLGKALIFTEFGEDPKAAHYARNYSALLDLMALQIQSLLPERCSAREKIDTINRFVFETMHYRFPPESLHVQKIDRYTFLASVMDNHLGVCLGVSALYLSLSQRLDLKLESYTPPGHIFLSFSDDAGRVNIETTARGVDLSMDHYLTIHTHSLTPRSMKEVLGLVHVNEGSGYLNDRDFEKAASAYEKALLYIENDLMTCELLGFCYLFLNQEAKGRALLRQVVAHPPIADSTKRHKMAEDYLAGQVDLEGLRAVLQEVDETRESLHSKKRALQETLKKYPKFRDGIFQMAVTCLMLNQTKDAIGHLKRLILIDKSDPELFYYMTVLHGQRKDYKSAWSFFKQTQALLSDYPNLPKRVLAELEYELTLLSPEPKTNT